MADLRYTLNPERACLVAGGEEVRPFLQGLLSNDLDKVKADRAIYAALLNAQGRFLHDLFIAEMPQGLHRGALVLDGEAGRLDDLERRLTMYRLRAKVTIADAREELSVALLWGEGASQALVLESERGTARALEGGVAFVDPRLAALGCRAILPRAGARATLERLGFVARPLAEHRRLRLSLGVAEGSADMPVEEALVLESGFEELGGVDFKKGCFIGQEVTARMKYRSLVKKRLLPVELEGTPPPVGTPVTLGGAEVGELRSTANGVGLALLRLEAVEAAAAKGEPLAAGEATLRPLRPSWLAV